MPPTITLNIGTHTSISIHCLTNILHSELGRMAILPPRRDVGAIPETRSNTC